jgi:chondroitin AC lyase
MLLMGFPSGASAHDDQCEALYRRYIQVLKEKNPAPDPAAVTKLIENQNIDGSWSNVDYEDKRTNSWKGGKHLKNLNVLALHWLYTGEYSALLACHCAMEYWFSRPELGTHHWWYKMIYVPREIGQALLILKKEITPKEKEAALRIMNESFGHVNATGQNKVALASNRLVLGLFNDDFELVKKSYEQIASEVVITEAEGLQEDMSYHQHGPMMQFGNYGLAYAKSMSEWVYLFAGTPMEFPKENRDLICRYVQDGLRWVVWNGYFDMSALGRQIYKGNQTSKTKAVTQAISNLAIKDKEPQGAKYFYRSDFGVYRSDKWYASIRMQSTRVKGYEYLKENMKGYFSSDGALLVRVEGDEYEDVAACWDWLHVPGTTTYDNGVDILGREAEFPYNRTDKVFGKVDGEVMVAAMDYDRDGLTARKAWFFYPGGIICLGTGISMDADNEVVTTVNQCNLSGEITYGKDWAFHDNVAYLVLDCAEFVCGKVQRSGNWSYIKRGDSKRQEKKIFFDMHIPHGKAPKNASYSYMVVPAVKNLKAAQKKASKDIKVLQNTPEMQSVSICGKIYTVDWSAATVKFD